MRLRCFCLALLLPVIGCRHEPVTELSRLEDALRKAENQTERDRLVDVFWSRVSQSGTPLFTSDTTVEFLYRGPAQHVRVMGDMTGWQATIELNRITGSDLFAAEITLPADARVEYKMVVDQAPISDPMCKYSVPGGFGASSEIAMPHYEYHPLLTPFRDGSLGGYERVTRHLLPSSILGYQKEIHVYTPRGYDDHDDAYPTVYFQDGFDYIEYAHTPAVLDELTQGGSIRPVVAVFISPPNRGRPDKPNRGTEYHVNPDYAAWMADELVPFIEANYRVKHEASERMVVGASSAGLAASYIPFQHPEAFGIGYSQSGYVTFKTDTLMSLYASADMKPIRLFVDVGVYETTVGKGIVPDRESDLLEGNRRFRDVLLAKGYDVVYREYPEGHTYGSWRQHLIDVFEHFFPTMSE